MTDGAKWVGCTLHWAFWITSNWDAKDWTWEDIFTVLLGMIGEGDLVKGDLVGGGIYAVSLVTVGLVDSLRDVKSIGLISLNRLSSSDSVSLKSSIVGWVNDPRRVFGKSSSSGT